MDKRTIEIAKKIVKHLREKGVRVQKIILFGSRARKENLKTLDYDFIIVSDDFKNIPYLERLEEVLEIGENVDVICLTSEEFEKEKNFLGSVVSYTVKEGVEIDLEDLN